MDVKGPPVPEVGLDPELDTTNLPADHAPRFLAEARGIFQDRKPPFVITTSNTTNGSKRLVFIAKDGQRPLLPIRTNLIARFWGARGSDGIYWTLDLNGERLIVLSFPNSGCISGNAKWVYCCWTGVGEEFDDKPVAFSCINGEYTGTRTGKVSTAATHQPMKEHTSIGATAHTLRRDHLPKITPLPNNHPVEFLVEAKALYANSKPPFVIQKTKKIRRRVLLATQDGRFSASSAEHEVVHRHWDSTNDYPTLDLDRKRFIVMGNPGGPPGGYQYHLWLGSKTGRVQKVTAYSQQYVRAGEGASSLTQQQPEESEDSEDLSLSSSSEEAEDQDSRMGAVEDEQFFYDDFRKGFDPTAIPSSKPSKFSTRQSTLFSKTPAREELPHRIRKSTKRARNHTPPPEFGSKKFKTPAHVSNRISRRTHSHDSSDLSSLPSETPIPTPSTNDPAAPTPDTPNPPIQAAVSLPTLTLYKQTHTTLRATRDSNLIGFVPLRLLTCMTMTTLFSSVITASGHREDEGPITCLMAIFDWKEDNDVYKTIFIDKGTQGSFEIFLEIIDEAPCWKDEGGRCGVAVEVVRA